MALCRVDKGMTMEATALAYRDFIANKSQWVHECGFSPTELPTFLFDFQRHLVEWACRKGRGAIFADCGMGKTAMELAWAEQVIRRTNKPVLLLTPIAVGAQALAEADKFGIDADRSRDGRCNGSAKVWITNYEQLHKFNPAMFSGVVCDESSCIKNARSERKHTVTEFLRTIKHRLLCTATAAPNDFWELGTSSEALGLLGFRDMITTFFKQETAKDHLGWGRVKYRFRGHAQEPFWAWVCSWARSLRKPSDLGFDDSRFELPPLITKEYVVQTAAKRAGMLFSMPGVTLEDQREERRNSVAERCDMAAELVEKVDGHSVLWCELNAEGDRLARVIPDSKQITGSMSDEQKEEYLIAFSAGQIRNLITKPKIGAWGLNWQHCNSVVSFPSHSYEQFYQAVRRCWRFGQKKPVNVSVIVNEGEAGILANLKRKEAQANTLFASIVAHMQDAMHLASTDFFPDQEVVPQWL